MTRTTNAGVLDAFLNGDSARSGSLTSHATYYMGNDQPPAAALLSYETEIAYATPEYVYINPTRYSVTTSKQRTQLLSRLGDRVPEADTPMPVPGPKEPYCARRYVTATFHAYRRS